MIFDYNTIPFKDKNAIKHFCQLCVEQYVNLENTKKNGYYKVRATIAFFENISPYLTNFFNEFQISLNKEEYTCSLIWSEEVMPKILKFSKEVQMNEKLQEIKKDF